MASLTLSAGTLSPQFAPATTLYVASVPSFEDSIRVTATAAGPSTLEINGVVVASGAVSAPIPLTRGGLTSVNVRVMAPSGASLVYGIVIARAAGPAYVKSSNPGAFDNLGISVAASGDTLAVGAYGESSNATGIGGAQGDNSAPNAGAVYVFTRAGGVWTQQAYIKASNTGGSDFFGTSVALDGDTLVVGAPGEDSSAVGVGGNQADNSAPSSGAAYVFTRSGGVWRQQAYLKASNTGASDRFGVAVAVSGDTLVVGADGEASGSTGVGANQADNTAPWSGAAFVFTRNAGIWTQQAYLKASNAQANDEFGAAVSISGDTLVVGAWGESSSATGVGGNQSDNSASQSGAAYVFTRAGSTWTQQAYVKASNTGADDEFGISVSLSGDTLAVGADGEASFADGIGGIQSDNSSPGSGAVYVFTRSGTTWTQQAYVKASNTGPGDLFGYAVSVSGDTMVVGASNEASAGCGPAPSPADNSANFAGAAYVFTRTGGVWTHRAYLKAANCGGGDIFGSSVSTSGDLVAIGAPGESSNAAGLNGNGGDNSAQFSGAVYTWSP